MIRLVEHWTLRGEPARFRRSWYHRVLNIARYLNETLPADWVATSLEWEREEYVDQQRRFYALRRRIEAVWT